MNNSTANIPWTLFLNFYHYRLGRFISFVVQPTYGSTPPAVWAQTRLEYDDLFLRHDVLPLSSSIPPVLMHEVTYLSIDRVQRYPHFIFLFYLFDLLHYLGPTSWFVPAADPCLSTKVTSKCDIVRGSSMVANKLVKYSESKIPAETTDVGSTIAKLPNNGFNFLLVEKIENEF